MRRFPLQTLLPGFLAGCLWLGFRWQLNQNHLSDATAHLAAAPTVVSSRAAPPPLEPALKAADLEEMLTSLLKLVDHDKNTQALGMLESLTWGDAVALLRLTEGSPETDASNNYQIRTLRSWLFGRMLVLHSPASVEWALREGAETDRLTWLEPLARIWKKADPAAWKQWFSLNKEKLRPADEKSKVWKDWLEITTVASTSLPLSSNPTAPPLDEVMRQVEANAEAEAQNPNGTDILQPMKEWGTSTGRWQSLAERVLSMPDNNIRHAALELVLSEWSGRDFTAWAGWVDQLPSEAQSEMIQRGIPTNLIRQQITRDDFVDSTRPEVDLTMILNESNLNWLSAKAGSEVSDAVVQLMDAWLDYDEEAASRWMAGQPATAPWQDLLKNQRAQKIGADDPAAALAIAASITDPDRRASTMENVYQSWSYLEPEAALSFIGEHYEEFAAKPAGIDQEK